MYDAVEIWNGDKAADPEWDDEEMLLMPSIVSAFKPNEIVPRMKVVVHYIEWTVLETNVSIC
ncbi:MAG: hypothetical protein IT366_20025 [Candidatus Hydrogenedentes bacterium]|nr:hypothetical protein [Candidatus Hydrogenedentota bacterium]